MNGMKLKQNDFYFKLCGSGGEDIFRISKDQDKTRLMKNNSINCISL